MSFSSLACQFWDPQKVLEDLHGHRPRPAPCDEFKLSWIGEGVRLSAQLDESVGSIAYNLVDREYMVVWDEHDITVPFDHVLGQRLDPAGGRRGAPFVIVEPSELRPAPEPLFVENSLGDPFVAHDLARNEYLVVGKWQHRPGIVFINEAFARRFSADGSARAAPFVFSLASFEPSVAYDVRGDQYLATGRTLGGPDMQAQRIAGGGGPLGPSIQITEGGDNAPAGEVTYNPAANEFLTVWRDQIRRPMELHARRIGPDGSLRATEATIPATEPAGPIRAAVDPELGRYLVTYPGFQTASVHGRLLDASLAPLADEITFASTPGTFMLPAVGYIPYLRVYVVAWISSAGLTVQLVGQRGNLIGSPQRLPGPTGFDVRLAVDPILDRVAVVWNDHEALFARVFGPICKKEHPAGCDGREGTGPPPKDGGGSSCGRH